MRRAMLVVILLGLAAIPMVQATGGVIQNVTISGNGEVGEGPIDVNLTIVGVGGASSASVNWSAVLSDLEGVQIDADSGNVVVNDGEEVNVVTTLSDAPLGVSNLSVVISGDLGSPNSTQSITWSTSIQRLRPLDISLANPIYTAIDSSGNETGNLTVRDGDFARIDVALINDGDVSWSGMVNASVEDQNLPSVNANISGDSSEIISFETDQLLEGTHQVEITLDGPTDGDSSDEVVVFYLLVGPPLLPELEWTVSRDSEAIAGTSISWTVNASSIGEVAYNGVISCSFEGEEIFSEVHSIEVSNSVTINPSTTARPGNLSCMGNERTISNNYAHDQLTISSAVFIGAGHSSPTLLQGPWHAGDEILISILLRNEGDAEGHANMRIEESDSNLNGDSISLIPDGAGEVHYAFNFSTSGQKIVNWSVFSIDGAVDSNLSGQVIIPVLDPQVIDLDIAEVSHTEDGVQIDWSIELEEGRDRTVILGYGSENGGIRSAPLEEERNLLPGVTSGSIIIGETSADEVYFTATLIDWSCDFSSDLDVVSDIPSSIGIPVIELSPITQPAVPDSGEIVTIFYTLENEGEGELPVGQIIFMTLDGTILSSLESPVITSETSSSTMISWPEGDDVSITAKWYVDGLVTEDEITVESGIVEDEAEAMVIPWGGILGGIGLGVAVVLVVRIRSAPKKEKKDKYRAAKPETKPADEKIEVACPSCDRRLKVPSTYSGGVRCPECETRFEVEGEEEEKPEVESVSVSADESAKVEPITQQLWSSSSDDILSCPKCTRSLKVPYERRPAKARCPACETIFEARSE